MDSKTIAMMALESQLEEVRDEVRSVLTQLDELADTWADEAVFRRCRDRLRKLVESLIDD